MFSNVNNRRFKTADSLLNKNHVVPKQTGTNQRKENSLDSNMFKDKSNKVQHVIMPLPRIEVFKLQNPTYGKKSQADTKTVEKKEIEKSNAQNDLKYKSERQRTSLIGKVDFCLKMQKMYPNKDVIWSVYGKLVKIVAGKNRNEEILIIRSSIASPILQCIFYDFEYILKDFQSGCSVRAVGRFIGENRLQTFKILKIVDLEKDEDYFHSLQNMISFQLAQKSSQSLKNA